MNYGTLVFAGVAGKDATKPFDKYHRRGILGQDKHQALIVGKLECESKPAESSSGGWRKKLRRYLG